MGQVASIPHDVIIGRARIAHALGRSERTVTRWLRRGILPTMKAGPHDNNLLMVRVSVIEKLKNYTDELVD